jgi:farnesyl-diphosphate farnesyltransferase
MANGPAFARCWEILPEVSRSFALVIRRLPGPLDDTVMVSYLLCRIADTLEDSTRPPDEKRRMLARFGESLETGTVELPTDGAPAACRVLLNRVDDVLACYRTFRPGVRKIIHARVAEMCAGMSKWCDREIATFADQNEYCYYVAGLVGKLLTDLFHAHGRINAREKAELDKHAIAFGLALQKVNVLRDVRADLEEGRCYWPAEALKRRGLTRETLLRPENLRPALATMDEMIDDLWPYLGAAVRYLIHLPVTQLRVRIFCSIPLFMALATIGVCRRNPDVFLSSCPVKITAARVRSILIRSFSFASFNGYVQSWYRRWRGRILVKPSPV